MSFLNGVSVGGLLLPFEDFRPLFDYKSTDLYIAPENIPEIVKPADELLDTEIPMLTASLYREFELNGNRTHYEEPYFLRKRMMFAFAFAEYATHSGKYMHKLIDLVWDTLNMPSWGVPAHTSSNTAVRPEGVVGQTKKRRQQLVSVDNFKYSLCGGAYLFRYEKTRGSCRYRT